MKPNTNSVIYIIFVLLGLLARLGVGGLSTRMGRERGGRVGRVRGRGEGFADAGGGVGGRIAATAGAAAAGAAAAGAAAAGGNTCVSACPSPSGSSGSSPHSPTT